MKLHSWIYGDNENVRKIFVSDFVWIPNACTEIVTVKAIFFRNIMTFSTSYELLQNVHRMIFRSRSGGINTPVLQSRPLKRLIQRQRLKLIFGRCSVGISAGTLAILIEGFLGFPQSFQENSEIVPKLDHGRFLPKPVQCIFHRSFYDLALSEILTAS
jgi:hypothetical protein